MLNASITWIQLLYSILSVSTFEIRSMYPNEIKWNDNGKCDSQTAENQHFHSRCEMAGVKPGTKITTFTFTIVYFPTLSFKVNNEADREKKLS